MSATVSDLRRVLRLDPATGLLYWRAREVDQFGDARFPERACNAWNARYADAPALTTPSSYGYRCGAVFGRMYLAHRVVFAMHYGRWPDLGIDHVNGDKTDNRPENLREATPQQNQQNVGPRKKKAAITSTYCGVQWHAPGGKWTARCRDQDGRSRSLGYFSSEVEAAAAYDQAAKEFHGKFARLNFGEVQ